MKFTCDRCGKDFKPTKINGELYMVRGIHFATNQAQSKDINPYDYSDISDLQPAGSQ